MIALNQLMKNVGVYSSKKGAEFSLGIIHLVSTQKFPEN